MTFSLRLALLLPILLLGGGEKIMQNMYDQPKLETFEGSELFPDGKSARQPVAHTIAREDTPVPQPPPTSALITRGQERFNIYCAPCHSQLGDGDGMVPQRGFPHPPSFHIPRLRQIPDQHIYDVITHGHGVMYPYASRVPPHDRWAIIAYIRALQLSQHIEVSALSEQDLRALEVKP